MVENLQIFKDISKKTSITLPDFKRKPTFENLLITNQESNSFENVNTTTDEPKPIKNSKSQSSHTFILKTISAVYPAVSAEVRDEKQDDKKIQVEN